MSPNNYSNGSLSESVSTIIIYRHFIYFYLMQKHLQWSRWDTVGVKLGESQTLVSYCGV